MANYSQRYNATTQTTTAGAFKFDTISSVDWPVAKLIWGEEGATNYASAAAPLPVTAAAAEALLTTIDTDTGAIATSAASIDGKITACNTGAVVVSSSALPSGAATAANQLPDGHNVRANYAPGTIDVFGRLITGRRLNQIDVQFFQDTPGNLITVTTANGGAASSALGGASFATGTNVSGSVKGVSTTSTTYSAGAEIFMEVTASFTAPTSANSFQRIGLYDNDNGLFIGYEGTTFGVTLRNNGVDTQVAKASFSEDALTGGATSAFTRAGVAEAIDLTKQNVFRIRFGWQGSAPIFWEVMAPDGEFVTFHVTRQPNLGTAAHIRNPNLPITIHASKTSADATSLVMTTNSWGAGATISQIPLNSTISTSTLADVTRAVIAGETTAGGGAFVNVKVNPSGTLQTAVSGTVTAELSAVDNAVLDAIAASAAAVQAGQLADGHNVTIDNASIAVTGTFWQATQPVSAASLPLPSGAATAANQLPDGHNVTIDNAAGIAAVNIQDGGNSITVDGTVAVTGTQTDALTDTQLRATAVPVSGTVTAELSAVDNAVLDAIAASIASVDGKVTAANTGAVTISSALPAGTNNIGDVDVLSLPALPTGTNSIGAVTVAAGAASFVKLEDDASANLDAGVPAMAVRRATPVNSSGADGDYEMLQMSAGRLWVSATISSGTVTANLSATDNAVLDTIASTVQADTTSLLPTQIVGGLDAGTPYAFQVTSSGVLKVSLASASGTAFVSGNGTSTNALRVSLANDSTGVLDTVGTVTNLSQMAGAAIAMDTGTRSAGTQRVTIATDDVVSASQSGTWTVGLSAAQTLATVTTVSTLTGGGIAHDTADSGNPHKVGARAKGSLSAITLVAADDRTDLFAGLDGIQIVRPHSPLEDLVSGVAAITDGSSTSVIAAQGAGVKTYITSVTIANTSATAVTVDLRDGTAGSVKWTFPVPADTAGVVHTFPTPLGFSANTIVAADPSAAASTVTVSLSGFKSKV